MEAAGHPIASIVFWLAVSILAYTIVGYPAIVMLLSAIRPGARSNRPKHAAGEAKFTVLLAVRNEIDLLRAKLENLLSQSLVANEILVIGDGIDLRSRNELAAFLGDPRVRFLGQPANGKACALNLGLAARRNEIAVFVDVRQRIAPDAIENLLLPLADDTVGCVSGKLILEDANASAGRSEVNSLGAYWSLETRLREAEGRLYSVVGATGALYAARVPVDFRFPPGLILDDVYLPMTLAMRGLRTVEAPQARCFDQPAAPVQEFRRKVRTLSGNYQLLRLMPDLLSRRNPLLIQFVSHKLLRLLTPVLLILILVSSALAPATIYRLFFWGQAAAYIAGVLALVPGLVLPTPLSGLRKVAEAAAAFVLLQAAAAVAMFNSAMSREVSW